MKFFHRLLFLIPFYFLSCKPQEKLPNYFENSRDTSGKSAVSNLELKIQKNDLLSIQISSLSTKPNESDIFFNQVSQGITNSNNVPTTGYLVDANGNIEHHRLGVIHVEGMTKTELANEIKKRLTVPVELLTGPTVNIRFLNFKVTVLGEVSRPGNIPVPGEKINILEAIGLAGDINQYGLKNKVKVVREIEGKRERGIIDLSSDSLFDSPYFNLVQNDIIIVDPASVKQKTAEQALITQKASFAISIATVLLTIGNFFR
jgi:polysaccharide export outer membrane protein